MSETFDAKILSVDDTASNLLAMRALLEPLGCFIQDAHSGPEAVQLAAREEFAVILLDVMMPVMDGLETLARLRSTALVPNTPVILVQGADRGTRARGCESRDRALDLRRRSRAMGPDEDSSDAAALVPNAVHLQRR